MVVEPRKASFGLTFLNGALVFCLFLALAAWWFRLTPPGETYDEQRAAARVKRLSDQRLADARQTNHYAWSDKEKGLVQIPVARAMELVLPDLQAKGVRPSSVAVEVPYPAGLQPVAPAPAPPEPPKEAKP
jgi:hypothetical protein